MAQMLDPVKSEGVDPRCWVGALLRRSAFGGSRDPGPAMYGPKSGFGEAWVSARRREYTPSGWARCTYSMILVLFPVVVDQGGGPEGVDAEAAGVAEYRLRREQEKLCP